MDSIVLCDPALTLTPCYFKVYFFFLNLENKAIWLPSKALGIKNCVQKNMSLTIWRLTTTLVAVPHS